VSQGRLGWPVLTVLHKIDRELTDRWSMGEMGLYDYPKTDNMR